MKQSLTKEDINQLPLMKFEGKILVIVDPQEVPAIVAELMSENALGFDTETRPSFQKGQNHKVSLLQLATQDKAYLFRLKNADILKELFPVLTSPTIMKVGVAIRDDLKALQRLHPFEPAGFVDIALQFREGHATPGLRALAAQFLGVRISKGAKLTNWNAPELSSSQLEYAAKDAVAGLMIFLKLNQKNF